MEARWTAVPPCPLVASPRKGEGRGPLFPHPSPRVLVELARPLLTEPISHSDTGPTPPPPPKNKIKRDLSSSCCDSSSLLRQQRQLSWGWQLFRDCPVSLGRGPGSPSPWPWSSHSWQPLPVQPFPPGLSSRPAFQPRNILNGFNLKTSEAIPFHIFKVHRPSIGPSSLIC